MVSRKTSAVVTAAAGILIGGAVLAQQAGQDRSNGSGASDRQSRSGTSDQSGRSGQSAQSGRQADEQISQVLAQIAQDPKTAADKLFLLTTALHNQAELDLAKEVAQKSQNPQVKQMAQRMTQELQRTHDQIRQTAQAVGLQLPDVLGQAQVQEVNIVAALPADQLDRQYTAQAQMDNAQDLSQYQSEAQIARDPQVKRFAQDQIRGTQQRSQEANQTARGMGMPGGEEAQPAGGAIRGSGTEGTGAGNSGSGTGNR
jgi:predicted outer membrane protein